MTYAPGTWTARGLTISTNYGGGKSHKVADARQPLFTPECQHANARLIAAAPDLLAALEALMRWETCDLDVESAATLMDEVCSMARAAIAKAKGE